jgi:hypothetical protein
LLAAVAAGKHSLQKWPVGIARPFCLMAQRLLSDHAGTPMAFLFLDA